MANGYTTLLSKEFKTEWRQKYTLFSVLLYVIATVFICYQVFRTIGERETWNALLWIILVFAAVTSSTRILIAEGPRRQFYLYSIANPRDVILARATYQGLSFVFLAFISVLCFTLFLGEQEMNLPFFSIVILLGAFGMASILTVTSSIASKGKNAFVLASILGLPLLLPLVTIVLKLTKVALMSHLMSQHLGNLAALGALNVLIYAMAYLLFPYLWRD